MGSVRTAVTARSARKWLLGRGLGSRLSKNLIKKRSREGPGEVRAEDVKFEAGRCFAAVCARGGGGVGGGGWESSSRPHGRALWFRNAVTVAMPPHTIIIRGDDEFVR